MAVLFFPDIVLYYSSSLHSQQHPILLLLFLTHLLQAMRIGLTFGPPFFRSKRTLSLSPLSTRDPSFCPVVVSLLPIENHSTTFLFYPYQITLHLPFVSARGLIASALLWDKPPPFRPLPSKLICLVSPDFSPLISQRIEGMHRTTVCLS